MSEFVEELLFTTVHVSLVFKKLMLVVEGNISRNFKTRDSTLSCEMVCIVTLRKDNDKR